MLISDFSQVLPSRSAPYLRYQGLAAFEGFVDVLDVFNAGGVKPVLEGLGALFGVDRDSVFPGGAAAEDAIELGAGFAGEGEGLDEDRV